MAPLQKKALYSFIIGFVLTAAMILIFISQGGIDAFDTDLNARLPWYAAIIGVPLIYGILVSITLRKPRQVDERDRHIMEQSFRVQWMAIIFTLVAWTISLTEIYHDQGQMPLVLLTIIMFSIFIISTLAQSLGILIGYWRMGSNG